MDNKWIAHGTNRDNAEVNLLLFTYAGGSPSLFAPWKKLFRTTINVCPVLYPGRELRKNESLPESVQQMAADFAEKNADLFQKDFVLFGHCTGILVAYETAKYVKKRWNREPLCIIASGTESPRYSMERNVTTDEEGNFLSDETLLQNMIRYEFVSREFADNKNFIQYYIPIYRNDLKMMSQFSCGEILNLHCPIAVMYGAGDKNLRGMELHDWDHFTEGKVCYHEFPGGHFYLAVIKETMVKEITRYIDDSRKDRTGEQKDEENKVISA